MRDIVWAQEPLVADTHIRNTAAGSNFDGEQLILSASFFEGVCRVDDALFVKFDLSDRASAFGGEVALQLNANFVSEGSDGELTLYTIDDEYDLWEEDVLAATIAPPLGSVLDTIALPSGAGAVQFSSNALRNYLNAQSSYTGSGDTVAGNDIAGFAIQITNCTTLSSIVSFDSSESDGIAPQLTTAVPTANRLTAFSINDNPVAVVLLTAALLLIGSLVIAAMRRRA